MHTFSLSRFCAGLMLLALTCPCDSANARQHDDILIGQSASLSGTPSRNGLLYSEGGRLYFDEVNRRGGILGRRLRLLRLDDRGRPQLALANTRTLLEQQQLIALFGYSGPATSRASLPLAGEAGIPFFAPRSGSYLLQQHAANRMLFTVRANRREEFGFLVSHFASVGMRRVVILHADDSIGDRDVTLITQLLHQSGGQLVAGIPVGRLQSFRTETDETAEAIIQLQPDAVVISGDAAAGAAVIRELRHRRYPIPSYGLSHLGALSFKEMLGKHGVGVALMQTVPFPWQARNALAAEYRKTAEAQGQTPSFVGLEGYLAAKVLCEGLRRAGQRPTREKLVLALESINDSNYDVGGFSLNFSAGSHHGSRYVDISTISSTGEFLN